MFTIQFIYHYQGNHVQLGVIGLRKHGFLGNDLVLKYYAIVSKVCHICFNFRMIKLCFLQISNNP